MPLMPVDRHVERVSQRIGLLPPKATADQAHDLFLGLLQPEEMYAAHVLPDPPRPRDLPRPEPEARPVPGPRPLPVRRPQGPLTRRPPGAPATTASASGARAGASTSASRNGAIVRAYVASGASRRSNDSGADDGRASRGRAEEPRRVHRGTPGTPRSSAASTSGSIERHSSGVPSHAPLVPVRGQAVGDRAERPARERRVAQDQDARSAGAPALEVHRYPANAACRVVAPSSVSTDWRSDVTTRSNFRPRVASRAQRP